MVKAIEIKLLMHGKKETIRRNNNYKMIQATDIIHWV